MKILFRFFLLLQIFFTHHSNTLASENANAMFSQGVTSYEAGDIKKAIRLFQKALSLSQDNSARSKTILNLCASFTREQSPSEAVAYCAAATNENINNSFAKEYLRQSLGMVSLEPQLNNVLDQQVAGIPWARIIGELDWLIWGMLSLYLCGFVLTLICYRKLFFLPLKLLGLIFASAAVFQFTTGLWLLKNKSPWGAIVATETEVLASPDPNAVAIAKPKAGVPIELVKSASGWNQIQLLTGEKGWVPANNTLFPGIKKFPSKPQKEALEKG